MESGRAVACEAVEGRGGALGLHGRSAPERTSDSGPSAACCRRSLRACPRVVPLAAFFLLALALAPSARQVFMDRWFYSSHNVGDQKQLERLIELVDVAAAHGLNGLLLSSGFGALDLKSPQFFENLARLKRHCDARGIEIIPLLMSVGYAGALLAHDPNLAAGLPVRDALFVVHGREARLVADPPVEIKNGGFERWKGNRCLDFAFHDKPGKISFPDRSVFKEGKTSIRFESFHHDPKHGHARIMQRVRVHPYRAYVVSSWVKTENLSGGGFRIAVYAHDRPLTYYDPRVPATTDWRRVNVVFNSLANSEVRVYAGVWGAKAGKFWIDGMQISEIGLVNVLRRPGTPVKVRSEATGVVYEEGRDYQRIVDPKMRVYRPYHEPPPIRLAASSRIKDGERLRVSWYHPVIIGRGQVTACMSEPKIYEIWRKQVELLHKHLKPGKYLLSMDEIRAGGSCEACRSSGKSMAQILGECITRQYRIIKSVNPQAEVYIWSDMLDPNHNAHANYYMVEGDFTGSWNYIPKDLIIACWHHRIRDKSLKHFSSLGFRTIGAAYYDADDLQNPKDWIESLKATPGARGIIYTTWRRKYELLAPFGDLVTREMKRLERSPAAARE